MGKLFVALTAITVLTFFVGLGSPSIADSDEAFYAESAREMVESGNWLTPHFNYVYRFEKPVLYYWLAGLSYLALGVSEMAARLPSAFAGLGLTLVTFFAARRWYGNSTGFLAGAITATSFGYVAMARQALPDLTLAFFVTLTTWAGLRLWGDQSLVGRPDEAGSAKRGLWIFTVGLGMAGGILVKGPLGIILPCLVVIPIIVWQSSTLGSKPQFKVREFAALALTIVFLAAPWYLLMTFQHGTEYLDRFFLTENFDRFTTARYNAPRPFWYYLPIVIAGMLPWSPFLLLWIRDLLIAVRRRVMLTGTNLQLLWWAAAPIVFFSLSIGKQPRYILPVLPPLAILLASHLQSQISNQRPKLLFKVCIGITATVICLIGFLVYRATPLLPQWPVSLITMLSALIVLSGFGVLLSITRPSLTPAAIVGASIVIALGAHLIVLSSPSDAPVKSVAHILTTSRKAGEAYGRYRVMHRNLIFYTEASFTELGIEQAVTDFLGSTDRVLVVLPREDALRFELEGHPIRRLGEVQYLNTGGLTFQTLLSPDPTQYLEDIVVIDNQPELR